MMATEFVQVVGGRSHSKRKGRRLLRRYLEGLVAILREPEMLKRYVPHFREGNG